MFFVNLEFYATHLLQNTVQIHTASCCGGDGGCCGDGDEFQLISPYCSHKVSI